MLETACSAAIQTGGAPEGGWDTREKSEVSRRCLEVWLQSCVYSVPMSISYGGRPMQVLYVYMYHIVYCRWQCRFQWAPTPLAQPQVVSSACIMSLFSQAICHRSGINKRYLREQPKDRASKILRTERKGMANLQIGCSSYYQQYPFLYLILISDQIYSGTPL